MKKILKMWPVFIFYIVIIFGVIALNTRFEHLNKIKSADTSYTSVSTNQK